MVTLVLDSSIIIDFLRNESGLLTDLFSAGKKYQAIVPTIVVYELYRGQSMSEAINQKRLNQILSDLEIVPLSEPIAKIAGELDRHSQIKGNDALIAATCLYYHLPLATNNTKHFQTVPNLKLYPY